MYWFRFLGKENRRILNVSRWSHRLWLRSMYCERRTVFLCIDTVSYGTDTASCGSSGKKGPPQLCNVLPPASIVGVFCCNATRTVLSVLSYTLYTHFSELPQALCWSAIVFSVTRAVISCCQTYFDVIHCWPWIFRFLGRNMLFSSGCCH